MKLLPALIFTVSSTLFLPLALHAEDAKPAGAGAGRGEERLKMMTEKLGLTEEQQTKVKAIFEKNGPQLRELMAKGRDNLSEEEKTKVRELMKTQMEEIGAVLTPEQKEKMKAEREARGGAPGTRRGKADAAK